MQKISADLQRTVTAFYAKHQDIKNPIAAKRPKRGEWSLNEILGHLINSASNNQQRFLGLQFVTEMQFPPYQKYHLDWIGAEKLNKLKFDDLFLLRKQYNILVAHLITSIDPDALYHVLIMDDGRRVPLKDLAADYLKHMKIHLKQFEETLIAVTQ